MVNSYPHRHRYVEQETALSEAPLSAVTRLVTGGLFDEYIVFERHGHFFIGGGAFGDVRVNGAHLRATAEGRVTAEADATHPLPAIARALAAMPVEGFRAYGWVNWELSYANAGLPVGDLPIAHMVVPRVEVHVQEGSVLVRALDPKVLDRARAILAAPVQPQTPRAPRQVSLEPGRAAYRVAIQKAVDDIKAGLLQKVILSRAVPVDFPVDLVATYAFGRQNNTPARSFLVRSGGIAAAGFSPEIVCQVNGRHVVTQPLAGTRALSPDHAETLRLREELYSDPKEIFEHAISVKVSCDELLEICTPGTVKVDKFMIVEERGSVQHLASRVSGELAAGRTAWDGLRSTFPAVTASGVPKLAAYECIRKLESCPRGLYGGAVITVDSTGDMDAALVLRTIFQANGHTWLRAGAGIVELSRPEREYEETCEKLLSISRFLIPAH